MLHDLAHDPVRLGDQRYRAKHHFSAQGVWRSPQGEKRTPRYSLKAYRFSATPTRAPISLVNGHGIGNGAVRPPYLPRQDTHALMLPTIAKSAEGFRSDDGNNARGSDDQ